MADMAVNSTLRLRCHGPGSVAVLGVELAIHTLPVPVPVQHRQQLPAMHRTSRLHGLCASGHALHEPLLDQEVRCLENYALCAGLAEALSTFFRPEDGHEAGATP